VIGIFWRSLKRIHPVLRSLGGDAVAHAGFWIEPKRWTGLKAAAQRNQHVLRDVALAVARLLGLGAIDINMQQRLIELLLDAQVNGAGNNFSWLSSLSATTRLAARSLPTTWTSIGAGNPKSRIWLTMSAGRL
jgi:hypothetical protein